MWFWIEWYVMYQLCSSRVASRYTKHHTYLTLWSGFCSRVELQIIKDQFSSSNWSTSDDEFAANERACITVHAAAIGKIKIIALVRADMNKINTDTVTLCMSLGHVFHPSVSAGAIEIQMRESAGFWICERWFFSTRRLSVQFRYIIFWARSSHTLGVMRDGETTRNLRKFNNGEFLESAYSWRRHHRPVCKIGNCSFWFFVAGACRTNTHDVAGVGWKI